MVGFAVSGLASVATTALRSCASAVSISLFSSTTERLEKARLAYIFYRRKKCSKNVCLFLHICNSIARRKCKKVMYHLSLVGRYSLVRLRGRAGVLDLEYQSGKRREMKHQDKTTPSKIRRTIIETKSTATAQHRYSHDAYAPDLGVDLNKLHHLLSRNQIWRPPERC